MEVVFMAFIRAKELPPRSGNWYDYEVVTIHEDGKVKQKVIRHIGKSRLQPKIKSAPKAQFTNGEKRGHETTKS
jgi:hypothetical protein